jgi:hypothetical protein
MPMFAAKPVAYDFIPNDEKFKITVFVLVMYLFHYIKIKLKN